MGRNRFPFRGQGDWSRTSGWQMSGNLASDQLGAFVLGITEGSTTLIVDAKYRRHWDEQEDNPWGSIEEIVRKQHRSDLFQVLAYANLARTSRVIVCLAYPCTSSTWERMIRRHRVLHKAEINTGARSIALWLTAIPMATAVDKISPPLLEELRSAAA
jgi:5-methylcytosine-specific restriction endonuclease McrBC regulatory subunit McrC